METQRNIEIAEFICNWYVVGLFGCILFLLLCAFVFRAKSNYEALLNQERAEEDLLTSAEDLINDNELNNRINGYRVRNKLNPLIPDAFLKTLAKEHLEIIINQGHIDYRTDSDKNAVAHIYGLVSTTKKTIHSTFIGFESNMGALTKIRIEDINKIGTATRYYDGYYYTVTLLALFKNPLQ